jgi:hypothetical protein
MKATKKNVSAAILKKHGHKVDLVKGDGYHYFSTTESDWELAKVEPIAHAEGSMVYSMWLGDYDVDGWVAQYESLIEGVEMPDLNHDYDAPIVLKFY